MTVIPLAVDDLRDLPSPVEGLSEALSRLPWERVRRLEISPSGPRTAAILTIGPAVARPALLAVEAASLTCRFLLRPVPRRTTACCWSGMDRALPQDACWTFAQAAEAVWSWVDSGVVSSADPMLRDAHLSPVVADMAESATMRDRIFDAIDRDRLPRGARLDSAPDLHRLLRGAVDAAGATRIPLDDVVRRVAPTGRLAPTAHEFARIVETAHAEAHPERDHTHRSVGVLGAVARAIDLIGIPPGHAGVALALFRYLDCELASAAPRGSGR
ncbi:hypothetical protein [Microbacterium sp. HJ5]